MSYALRLFTTLALTVSLVYLTNSKLGSGGVAQPDKAPNSYCKVTSSMPTLDHNTLMCCWKINTLNANIATSNWAICCCFFRKEYSHNRVNFGSSITGSIYPSCWLNFTKKCMIYQASC